MSKYGFIYYYVQTRFFVEVLYTGALRTGRIGFFTNQTSNSGFFRTVFTRFFGHTKSSTDKHLFIGLTIFRGGGVFGENLRNPFHPSKSKRVSLLIVNFDKEILWNRYFILFYFPKTERNINTHTHTHISLSPSHHQ